MTTMTARHRLALRFCAAALCLPILSQMLHPSTACAQAPAGTVAAGSNGLFPDSRTIRRPRLSVEVTGSGPDVILIPGLASSRETYRRTAEGLRGRYRLHLVQISGFAGEPGPSDADGAFMEPVLQDLDGYIVQEKLQRAAIIGHSLGGELGLALAERHPDHLSRLMIVDALPFFGAIMGPTATPEQVRPVAEMMGARTLAQSDAEFTSSQTASVKAAMAAKPADIERIVAWSVASDRKVLVKAMVEDMSLDLRPGLAKVSVPVTVVYETALEPMVQAGYAPLANKTLIKVPDALHFIMFDQPVAFDSAVAAFLAPLRK